MKAQVVTIKARREGYSIDECYDTLTVKELIEALQEMPQDRRVYISNDDGYTKGSICLDDVRLSSVIERKTWYGEEQTIPLERLNQIQEILSIEFDMINDDIPRGKAMKNLVEKYHIKPGMSEFILENKFKNGNTIGLYLCANENETFLEPILHDVAQNKFIPLDIEYFIERVMNLEYDDDTYMFYVNTVDAD